MSSSASAVPASSGKKSRSLVHTVLTILVLAGIKLLTRDFTVSGVTDDEVYAKHSDVWETVPRGLTHITTEDGKPLCTLLGLRKFGYADAKPFGPTNTPHTVVFLTKANGENAKIAAFIHAGRRYWVVGSKHVSFVYEMGNLIEATAAILTQEKHCRFEAVIKIAMAWDNQPQSKCAPLHSELADGEWTLNCEIIYPEVQHIVPYTSADIQFVFFAVTEEKPSEKGLTALHPFAARKFCTSFELSFVTCSEEFPYNSSEYHAELDRITYQTDAVGRICSEGVVSYGMDAAGMVVQLYKHKSILYDLERAMRTHIEMATTEAALFVSMDKKVVELTKDETHPAVAHWIATRLPFLKRFATFLFTRHVLPIPEKREPAWLAAFDAQFLVASMFDAHKEFFAALKEARPEKLYSLRYNLRSRWITMQTAFAS